MATRKSTTSRPKHTKIDIKRSAPIQPADIQPGSNATEFAPSLLGGELLLQIKRAVGTFRILAENNSPTRANRAGCAATKLAETLALVPPRSSTEALAAAILIGDDLNTVLHGAADSIKKSAAERIEQRVAGLAAWIETAHGINRRDWRLDYFGADDDLAQFLPHAAKSLNILPDHDR